MNWRSTILPHVVLVGLAWLSNWCAPLPSLANEIDRISVIPDGSANPPGIRVDVMAWLDSEAKDAHLEVFAFLVTDTPDGAIPVAAMSDRNADEKGNLRIKSLLRVKGESVTPLQIKALEPRLPADAESPRVVSFRRSFVIPYADIKLPPGKHQVGYEVRLFVNDELEEIRPSRLTAFQVGREARDLWQLKASRMETRPLAMEVSGKRWQAGELHKFIFNVESLYSVEVPYIELCSTTIPRGFKPDVLDPSPVPLATSEKYVPLPKRTILFATNRNKVPEVSDLSKRFGDESEVATDQMHYGSCVTSIPIGVVRKPGTLNQPGSWWFFWKETPDPEKHFLILNSNPDLGASDFARALSKDDILIFVHGYNNTFSDSILRAAQLQHDLKFPGKVVAFSWPSSGTTLLRLANPFDDNQPAVKLAYQHDEEQAALSAPFLAHLLGQLLDEPSPVSRKVHVLAHSMGNRVLLHALHLLQDQRQRAEKKEKEPAMLGEVMMAAADVFGADYNNWRGALSRSCSRVTFYFSANDAALKLSQARHLNKPIGLEAFFDETKKMDTISADKLTSMFNRLGHNYVMESKPLLNDIRLLIRYGHTPINRRPPLSSRIESPMAFGNFFWTFSPYR